MNEWLIPVKKINEPLTVKVNGKMIKSNDFKTNNDFISKEDRVYCSAYLNLLGLVGLGLTQKLFDEISLFKQFEESNPVNGWIEKDLILPLTRWNLTSSTKTETFEEISVYASEVYQRFSILFKNLAYSGPVLIVILITMTLLIINQFVKEKTTDVKEESIKKNRFKKAD